MFAIIMLIIGGGAGWSVARRLCSPSCRKGAYLTTPELEQTIWDRGFDTGVQVTHERGKVPAEEWVRQVQEADEAERGGGSTA